MPGVPAPRRPLLATLLALSLAASLPGGVIGGTAASPQEALDGVPAAPAVASSADPLVTAVPAEAAAAARPMPPGPSSTEAGAPDLRAFQVSPGDAPSQMYLDEVAHEGMDFGFVPGGRVTVPFTPRADDGWAVGGSRPRALPAGRASGLQIVGESAKPGGALPSPAPMPVSGSDGAVAAPGAAPAGPGPIAATTTAFESSAQESAAALAATGMRREVYGFLPYWEVSDPSARLNFDIVTHVAYFSVGADAAGNLTKRNSDGSLTTGWAGWTSSKMTSFINAAHTKHSRVTLTLSVMAWTSSQAAVQQRLLGSATARLNLARQAVQAIRDRGADGINLDFEPLVSGSESGFVALIRTIRAEMNKVAAGYHLSFDTLGYPGNYPLEAALASGGADAVFVMGYDYRTASSGYAGSIDPLAGPAYDLADTVRTYVARVPASRVILGIPYYGRAWSTVSDAVNAQTQTGAKYGYSNAVNYDIAAGYAADNGRRYDSREVSAWTAYRYRNCTSTYGCLTTWRQIYYDDAETLKARYDLVNRAGLRGTGIWALGYDGTRPELYQALADKFLHDTTAPLAGITAFPSTAQRDEGFIVKWRAVDDWSGIAGYDVQASVDGGAWADWLPGTTATSAVYLGTDGHGYAFRVRARDGKGNLSAWNVTSTYVASPVLAKGGFLRVTSDTLNVRSAPGTSSSRVDTAASGDVFAITGGPASADGYTWYQVTGPITSWGPIDYVLTDAWVAASSSSATNAVATRAPNATSVAAGIGSVSFSGAGAGSLGSAAAAVAARSFSPNGDGSEDALAIRWNNRRAFDTLTLRVLRPDGSVAGTRSLANLAAGAQSFTWDGATGGATVADGIYVLQLVGVSAGVTYTWPSASPTANDQPARVGVVVDRVAPSFVSAALSATRFSPNGDGRFDSLTVTGRGTADAVRWQVVVAPLAGSTAGSPVRRIEGLGGSISAAWNGTADDGTRVPDGSYQVALRIFDAAGNPAARTWTAIVDTTGPALTVSTKPIAFSPDGDGAADSARLAWGSNETLTGTLRVLRSATVIRSWSVSGGSGAASWDGRDAAGRLVADGRYTVELAGKDALANGARITTTATVDRTAGWLRWSPGAFFPQDGDRLAPTSTVSVRLARTATLTLRILSATGVEVRRVWTGRVSAAGTAAWRWDGRTSSGAWAPQGRYVAELTAVSWLGTTVLRSAVVAAAFTATPSTATPGAGSTFSVILRSIEPLAAAPRATFRQAGRSAVPMTVVRLSNGSWRASVKVASGAPGPAVVSITARDASGGTNRMSLTVTVR